MRFSRIFRPWPAFAAACALLSSACTDVPTRSITPPPGETVRAGISCTVSVAAGQVLCAPVNGGGGSRSIILGGQGTYVRLASSALSYDSVARVFSVDVTVQNLLAQQMGTPDGVTATGVRVFFDRLPAATAGTGMVTVANADSTREFTGASQPYFEYPEILEPLGASQPRTWRFNVPTTVSTFSFGVYVDTELPGEAGLLRWQLEHGATTQALGLYQAVWGTSRDHVLAAYGRWVLMFQRGTGDSLRYHWSPVAQAPAPLNAIWGTSRSDVYVAGDSGVVMRYDGNRWAVRRAPSAPHQLQGLWSGGADVWAVGRRQEPGAAEVDGLILHSTDAGQNWNETLSQGAGKRYLRDVFRAGSSVFVVGYEDPAVAGASPRAGVVLRSSDGGQTWADSLFAGTAAVAFHTVWADGPNDVYIGGETTPQGGSRQAFILHSTDGGQSWSETIPGVGAIFSMWRIPGGDLLAAGGANLLANDGTGWRQLSMGCVGVSAGWRGIWASSLDDIFMVFSTVAYYRQNGCMWETFPGVSWVGLDRAAAVSMAGDYGFIVGATPLPGRAMLLTNQYHGPGITHDWGWSTRGRRPARWRTCGRGAPPRWSPRGGKRCPACAEPCCCASSAAGGRR